MTVSRRNFTRLAAASTAVALASPAVAQQPTVKWRLASSFPKSIEGLWGASPTVAKFVSEMSDGKFTIDTFAAGEIVPGLQVLDATANGTVECGHSYGGYYIGKNPTLIFDGSLPFGFTVRQHNAWYFYGDGKKLMDEVYDGLGVVSIPMGNTGGQTFGWFRKELKTPTDFSGIKMRVAGFGGKVLAKLGVIPQQIAGGDIYPALEKGTIDAAECRAVRQHRPLYQQGGLGPVARELSDDVARGLHLRAGGDARRIRCAQRQGAQSGGRGGRAARGADAGYPARAAHRARTGAG